MAFTQVTVTGILYLGDSTTPANRAIVNMTLSSYLTDGDNVIAVTTQTTTCDSTGAFSLTVPANDDPTTSPAGTYYTVVITSATGGSTLDSFTTVVSYKDAPTVDLYSLPRATSTALPLVYGVSSVNGETGAVTGLLPLAGGTMTGLLATAGQSINVRTLAAGAATSESTDQYLRSAGAGAAVSYPLPAATGSGRVLIFENADSSATPGVFTITPDGTDTIRGVNASVMCVQYRDRIALVDGAPGEWDLLEASLAPVTFTTSKSWVCPLTGWWDVECLGGGAGGSGGGSALTTSGISNQQGGGGGGAGTWTRQPASLTADTSYTATIGSGGSGGAGAAANGNHGGYGISGGQSSFVGTGVGVYADGGSSGTGGGANSFNSSGAGGAYGGGRNAESTDPSVSRVPGCGGPSYGGGTVYGFGGYPLAYGVGGGAGAGATATLGGVGGSTASYANTATQETNANTTTTTGGNGQNATVPGCGGGGGGGGAPGGAGGAGGAGSGGMITLTFRS